jgi:hypothetical protein
MCNVNLLGGAPTVIRPLREVEHANTTFLLTHSFECSTWSPTHLDQAWTWAAVHPPLGGTGLNFYFVDEHVEFIPYLGPMLSKWWTSHIPASSNPNWVYKGYWIYGP